MLAKIELCLRDHISSRIVLPGHSRDGVRNLNLVGTKNERHRNVDSRRRQSQDRAGIDDDLFRTRTCPNDRELTIRVGRAETVLNRQGRSGWINCEF